jgi:hypothetical protein
LKIRAHWVGKGLEYIVSAVNGIRLIWWNSDDEPSVVIDIQIVHGLVQVDLKGQAMNMCERGVKVERPRIGNNDKRGEDAAAVEPFADR